MNKELEAKREAEPVAWWFRDDPAVFAYAGSGVHVGKEPPDNALDIVPLYTQPPQTQAAVSAALRKAAEVCREFEKSKWEHVHDTIMKGGSLKPKTFAEVEQAILALPHDDSALRSIVKNVAMEVFTSRPDNFDEVDAIVERVMKGE